MCLYLIITYRRPRRKTFLVRVDRTPCRDANLLGAHEDVEAPCPIMNKCLSGGPSAGQVPDRGNEPAG